MDITEDIPFINSDYKYLQHKALKLEKKFNFVKLAPDGVIELFADNQMLSTLRLCEAKFELEHLGLNLNGIPIRSRGLKPWPLTFGTWLHECLQLFYTKLRDGIQIPIAEWLTFGEKQWIKYELDKYKGNDIRFDKMGGLPGAKVLLAHYWTFFGSGAEHFRVVSTEVAFGRSHEVPILDSHLEYPAAPFRAYLTGRIDLVIDDGMMISPVDHKSHSHFTGKEFGYFNPNEGPTGYIYALRHVMNNLFPDLIKQGRLCDSIWINHISLQIEKERFKRSKIRKTVSQLEEYKERMITSFTKLFELVFLDRKADWNTQACIQYFTPCQFKALHEQAEEDRKDIIKANYVEREQWNPYRTDVTIG